MKYFGFIASCIVLAAPAFTEESALTKDPDVVVGQLENGLTYYIRSNGFPKNQISLRLVVKAGSLHEEEDERGVAHFLEHMLFRGTEHFKDWEVINYLESIGAQFGADTNAFTNFDYTLYHFDIPTDKEDSLDKGLFILSDYAGRATLDPNLIEGEREVVMDEYNLFHRHSSGRIQHAFFAGAFNGSRYANRMPIGLESVIRGCDPGTLRKYYEKWYRPERMAVVVVGDLDINEVESLVQMHFSSLKGLGDAPEEPDHSLPSAEKQCIVIEEPEMIVMQTGIYLLTDKEAKEFVPEQGIKNDFCRRIYFSTLANRLDRLMQANPPQFLFHSESSFDLTLHHKMDMEGIAPFSDQVLDGLKALLMEMESLKKLGPTKQELQREMESISQSLKLRRAQIDRSDSSMLVQHYVDHFLSGQIFLNPTTEISLEEEYLPQVSIQDMIDWAENAIQIGKMSGFVLGEDVSSFSEEAFFTTLTEALNQTFIAGEEAIAATFESRPATEEDTHYTAEDNEEFLFKTLTLSNGMKVILHPSDLEKSEVSLIAVANGGSGLFGAEVQASIEKLSAYRKYSGLGNLNGTQLDSYMSEKGVYSAMSVFLNSRTISMGGLAEDIEILLQLLRAEFCDKRFDHAAWESLCKRGLELEKGYYNDPYVSFYLNANDVIHSSDPFYGIHWTNEADELVCQEVMTKLFSDPSEFTLIIVGDIAVEEVEKLAVKYMSFPASLQYEKPNLPTPSSNFPKEGGEVVIRKGKDSHCLNLLVGGGLLDYSHKDDLGLTMAALNHTFSFRLLEKLRQEMGETYGASAAIYLPLSPKCDEIAFQIGFTCEHANADRLVNAVEKEIARILQEGVSLEELNVAREILLQNHKQAAQSNNNWLDNHTTAIVSNVPLREIANFEERLDRQVTKERVDAFAKAVLEKTPVIKLRLMPEI